MASNQLMNFNWGDAVKLKRPEAKSKYGISQGSVCGFRVVEERGVSEKFQVSLGTILVTVEGVDGRSVEIPDNELELL